MPFRDRARALQVRFGRLLEAAPDAMLIADPEGRLVLVNQQAERLFGYARDELIGRPIEDLVPARHRERHAGHRTGYFEHPQLRPMGRGMDLSGVRRDGTEFPAEISLSPIETEDGLFAAATVRDVSDRRRVEAELRSKNEELREQYRRVQEANRLKSEFLANMSHELRTPLNAVIGFAELMHDGKVGPVSAQHKEFLGDILSSSRHLLQLINDVLDLSKIEAGKMEFRPEPVDVGGVAAEVRDGLRGLADAKRIPVACDVDRGLGTVYTDPAKLRQVLYNYLANAIKFTGEDGRVALRLTAADGERFRIEVEDNGVGIAADDLPRLFGEFQQLDSGTAKRYGGTGLGLALTKRIVEAQGGEVGVRSVPGEGSVFYAVLPRGSA